MKHRLAKTGVLVAAAALALSACAPAADTPAPTTAPSAGEELTTVKMIAVPVVDVAAAVLGVENGYFAEEGIDLQIDFAAGSALVPGVVSGEYMVGYTSSPSLVLASGRGVPVVGVAAGGFSTGVVGEDHGAMVVKADSDIQGWEDLAGKTIAVNQLGSLHEIVVRMSLENHGVDPADVTFVELGLPDMGAALDADRIDVAATSEPFITLLSQGDTRIVGSQFAEAVSDADFVTAIYFTTEDTLNANRELMEAFNRAMVRSLEAAQADEAAVRAAVGQFTDIDPTALETMVLTNFQTEVPKPVLQDLAERMWDYGILESEVNVDRLFAFLADVQ